MQIGLQLRPSKVGRPKGSRDKLPRVRKTDKARSSSQESFHILDSAINFHHIDSSGRAQSSVDQAHPTNARATPSSNLVVGPSPRVGVTFDKRHHVRTSYHATTPQKALHATMTFEPLDTRRPYTPAALALISGSARPFEPADTFHCCASDAAIPAHGAPGFADPFHFDWPHW